MKKFKFTLIRMRNYKDQILGEEKNTLARLRKARDDIMEQISNLEEAFDDLSREMQEEQERGMTVSKLQTYDVQLTSIRYQLEALRKELLKAQVNVDKQVGVVLLATQEVSKLEKLEERQFEEYKKIVAKAEEAFIDEFVTSDTIRKEIS